MVLVSCSVLVDQFSLFIRRREKKKKTTRATQSSVLAVKMIVGRVLSRLASGRRRPKSRAQWILVMGYTALHKAAVQTRFSRYNM